MKRWGAVLLCALMLGAGGAYVLWPDPVPASDETVAAPECSSCTARHSGLKRLRDAAASED